MFQSKGLFDEIAASQLLSTVVFSQIDQTDPLVASLFQLGK